MQLLKIAQREKSRYAKYVVDEMTKARDVTILRLPPYHCELNPIELIWAQIKADVARNNRTFKLGDLKLLLNDAISRVTVDTWSKCILHVKKEEQRMWDTTAEALIEPVIINLRDNSSSDSEFDSDSDTVLSEISDFL
ncbi:hypothetical protein NQ317_013335 [Molorchus minor]|uniref:Tc1-like transposase DDE domain-containing protein n=1 Tax=Molorchus minor TaxID=1323400 RepID=A0ABQ9JZL9_9CUCU|nr:hypothetical protein NQ317_013335 [Molorchus minor]